MRFGDIVLHNDHQIIACAKPAGMPTQEDKSGDASLHRLAQAYCKKDIYIVHRLDRPCSGLVVFAKTKTSAAALSAGLADRSIKKKYRAVIALGLEPDHDSWTDYIYKTGSGKVRVVDEKDDSKEAKLSYETIARIDNYALLEVIPETGRLHQIRAQFASHGFPIKGDVKYGARRKNSDRSIHLHSHEMTFRHPTKGEQVHLTCPMPDESVWNAFEIKTP